MGTNTTFLYNKKKQHEFPDSKIFFFELDNLTIDNGHIINKKDGVYFPIRHDANYSLLLWDYLGTFFKLKKIYPQIKPIFFITDMHKYDSSTWSGVADSFVDLLQAEVIDIRNESFLFEKVLLIEGDLPPIPLEIYSTKYWRYQELDNVVKAWWISNLAEVKNNFILPKADIKYNTYITRSKMNKLYLPEKNYWEKTRYQSPEYSEDLDIKIKNIGFNVFETTGINFLDQIKIGKSSKVYSTIDGSGLINGLWSDDDTEIICFRINKKYTEYGFYWEDIYEYFNKKIKIISLEHMLPADGQNEILKTLKRYV